MTFHFSEESCLSKDRILGALILVVCVLGAVGYVGVVFFPGVVTHQLLPWLPWSSGEIRFGAIAVVVLFAFLAVLFVGAWIGWTMATTPAPKPLEELDEGLDLPETASGCITSKTFSLECRRIFLKSGGGGKNY